jgi:hypothetical protein
MLHSRVEPVRSTRKLLNHCQIIQSATVTSKHTLNGDVQIGCQETAQSCMNDLGLLGCFWFSRLLSVDHDKEALECSVMYQLLVDQQRFVSCTLMLITIPAACLVYTRPCLVPASVPTHTSFWHWLAAGPLLHVAHRVTQFANLVGAQSGTPGGS